MLHQGLVDLLFPCPDNTIHDLAFSHEEKSGHRLDFELFSNGLQFVNVDLEEDNVEELLGHVYKDWCNEAARWAPCSSEVYHNLSQVRDQKLEVQHSWLIKRSKNLISNVKKSLPVSWIRWRLWSSRSRLRGCGKRSLLLLRPSLEARKSFVFIIFGEWTNCYWSSWGFIGKSRETLRLLLGLFFHKDI